MQIDLRQGVFPISKAAGSLAACIKRAANTGQPIVITQKGYPTGVLLSVEQYVQLVEQVKERRNAEPSQDT